MRTIGFIIALTLSTGCGFGQEPVPDNSSTQQAHFPTTVTVSVEQTLAVTDELSVRLDRLDNQLCPCRAWCDCDDVCVWQGFAEADVALIQNEAVTAEVMLVLGGHSDSLEASEMARTAIADPYRLRWDDVYPICSGFSDGAGVILTITHE